VRGALRPPRATLTTLHRSDVPEAGMDDAEQTLQARFEVARDRAAASAEPLRALRETVIAAIGAGQAAVATRRARARDRAAAKTAR
jgi:hypothetical protein